MESALGPVVPVLAFFGCLLGMLLISRVGAWAIGIRTLVTEARAKGSPASAASLAAALLLHSGPWLLAGFILVAAYTWSMPPRAAWLWFFGGVFTAPVIIAIVMRQVWKRQREKKEKEHAA